MQFIITPENMRKVDQASTERYGITSFQLMENAANSFVECLDQFTDINAKKLVILCGSGNNGGDGFAIARLIHKRCSLRVFWTGKAESMTEETSLNKRRCEELEIALEHCQDFTTSTLATIHDADIIIDAILGIGAHGALRTPIVQMLAWANAQDAERIAVDIPSGLDAATGEVQEHCFRADCTVTMEAIKCGMLLAEAPKYCGRVMRAAIGAPQELVGEFCSLDAIELEDIAQLLPPRKRDSSKFDYKRVCIIAGSRDMPGAAALCANAALRAGAGLVELCSVAFHPSLAAEVLQRHCPATLKGTIAASALPLIQAAIEKAQVVVVGCGLGDDTETLSLVRTIIDAVLSDNSKQKLIVDADALRVLDPARRYGERLVITPHAGECRRLIGSDLSSVALDTMVLNMSCHLILKRVPVEIRYQHLSRWNIGGNPGMATAGSGDVLAGITAAMLCRIENTHDACSAAVHIHSQAGDYAAEMLSQESMIASDIIAYLPAVLRECEQLRDGE